MVTHQDASCTLSTVMMAFNNINISSNALIMLFIHTKFCVMIKVGKEIDIMINGNKDLNNKID